MEKKHWNYVTWEVDVEAGTEEFYNFELMGKAITAMDEAGLTGSIKFEDYIEDGKKYIRLISNEQREDTSEVSLNKIVNEIIKVRGVKAQYRVY